jgi:ElaB/YqjD/DUF883 family membrane-anchored ribosome-binding protein
MNESQKNDPDAIRSDIDVTRRRMDGTMDALGDRLQPQHLLDEVLGFLRGSSTDGESRMARMREKVAHSCDSAMHSVVNTVKENPMPALVIGAGVAWLIYSSRHQSAGRYDVESYSAEDAAMRFDPDEHYDRPLDYPAGGYSSTTGTETQWNEQGESKLGEIKHKLADKASAATGQVKEKLSHAGEAAREKMGALRDRAGEVSTRVRESTREAYSRTRERVATTADQHPLEVGLVALAAGLITGLALHTPATVNRKLGPTADRLRDRTREAGNEMLQKGKRVAEAAVSAVKDEAQAQGLTPDRLREKASAVGDRAREAGMQSAQREGLTPGAQPNPSCPPGTDPTVARPAV